MTMKNSFVITLILFLVMETSAQVIFSEPFNEATGSTTGNDNTGGVAWNAVCGSCVPTGDYLKVNAGVLECDDTNGTAAWTTNNINTSSCTNGYIISVDISTAGATNSFEECTSGCGCNCVDWISLEYNANGNGFIPLSSAQGGNCTQGCSGGTYIVLGALSSGTSFTFSTCMLPANTLQLRISMQTWAQGEKYRVDNVTVTCNSGTCFLPIELISFDAKNSNNEVELNWITATEKNNNFFTVERSEDAVGFEEILNVKGAGNTNKTTRYTAFDKTPLKSTVSYYRLKQTDFDGKFSYSHIVALNNTNQKDYDFKITPNPSETGIFALTGNMASDAVTEIEVFDITGRRVSEIQTTENLTVLNLSPFGKGLYFVRIKSDNKIFNYKIIHN